MIATLALSGFLGQLAITKAFSIGKASIVAPFEYTALAWGVAIDGRLDGCGLDRGDSLGGSFARLAVVSNNGSSHHHVGQRPGAEGVVSDRLDRVRLHQRDVLVKARQPRNVPEHILFFERHSVSNPRKDISFRSADI